LWVMRIRNNLYHSRSLKKAIGRFVLDTREEIIRR
jgi:hypothetical protein